MSETPHEGSTPHHRSARERQRRGPMWGCLKALVYTFGGGLLLLALIIGGGWWYLGTASFAGLVKLRIEKTLEARLGRAVSIGSVEFIRERPQRVIVNDVRIANASGAVHPYFATVRQIEITGGIDSFWGRKIRVGRVDIRDPRIYFEIFPAGSKLVDNFPRWRNQPPGKYDIYHLDVGTLYITGGNLDFLDRRHDIAATASNLTSQVKVTLAEDVYEGTATSPEVAVRIQDYVPFKLDLRGGFKYTPNALALESIALRGKGMQWFLSGKVAPLGDAAYDIRVTSQVALAQVRQIFKINKVLDGQLALDGTMRGKAGSFTLAGKWLSARLAADAYTLTNARGTMNVTDQRTMFDVTTARYGGGTIGAHYVLPTYTEPYPMSVDLRYAGVSLEKLFGDWGVSGTGLRGGATGKLAYHWNKDQVLSGAGTGTATLSPSAVAFSDARYPLPLKGSTGFDLDNGVVRLRNTTLDTGVTQVDLNGTLRIADLASDLAVNVRTGDLSELDRIGYNFAHSAGKKSYTLLGLGGAGSISATVKGRLKAPDVVARLEAKGAKYNNAPLGDAAVQLRYDGAKSVLTFDHATFRQNGGQLALTGSIGFPDRGPSPTFDLAIDANGYPIEQAMAIVDLPMKGIHGLGTGRLVVTGSKESGRVTFAGLTIQQKNASLHLKGDIDWAPGTGTTRFNLDINANSFPIADIAEFLDLGALPATGQLTGNLHLAGTKASLEGAGKVAISKGTLFGEPVNTATADVTFTKGKVHATNVTITAPAGEVTGEAEMDLATNQFRYSIKSSSIDLSKIKLLSSLSGLLGGKLVISSSGGGTFDQPQLTLQATLNEATIRGLALPAGSPPPSLYVSIANGQLTIRGNIADLVDIGGTGTVGKDLALDGRVHITVPDVAKLVAISPSSAGLPASGHFAIDLQLGGKMSSLDTLRIDATFPDFDVRLSDHEFTAARPLRIGLRDGQIHFDDFELQHPGATLTVAGFASLVGKQTLDVSVRGGLEAALLQLVIPGLRADGHINIAAGVTGTLTAPRITGTAEVQNAQFRFPGFPQMIDNVTGTIVFRGDRIDIDSLKATLGGGQIVAGGSIVTDGLTPRSVRVTLRGTNVAIRYFEGLTVDGDFDLLLSGGIDRLALQGDVSVNRALYFREFDFTTAFLNVVLSRKTVTPIAGASWQDRVDLRLHIKAPGTLSVRNNVADVTGSADLDVNGTVANPVVLGLVTLDEGGRVRLQKVDYRVVSGSINFENPFRIDPFFDVTLEARVSNTSFTSDLESGPVDVTVNLTGTLDRFTPTVTSDPPQSDITLFSLLGFGGLTAPAGSTNATASTIGQSLLYQGLSGFLGRSILPFADTFTIDPGTLNTADDPGTKVTIGKRLSNKIDVLVIYNLTHSYSRALIEWQVNPEWTLQFTYDELRKEYSAEATYRKRFEGHWTWGGLGKPVTLLASNGPVADKTVPPPPLDTNGPIAAATGPNVASVKYRADSPFDTSILQRYVAVRPGRPLSLRAVQSSIKNLFATGDFRDVRAETQLVSGGIAVTFVLSLNYRIANLTFDGLTGADRDRASHDLVIHVGDVLSLNAVDRSAVAIQQSLNRSGYLEATVDPETTFQRATSHADVVFHVTEGPRAMVAAVTIDGDITPFTQAQLIEQMKNGPGKKFLVANARIDADRMQRFMIRRDYRKAEVRYISDTYDTASKKVTLKFAATSGPIVKVEVVGVPQRDVRKVLPFAKNQPYSEDVIDTAADKIVTLYQERGYYNATADTASRQEGNTWITTFTVHPGDPFKLSGVTFTGNQKVTDKTLRTVVQTAPSGGFRSMLATLFRRPQGVTHAQLTSDRDALESYYRLNGFSVATVATPVVNTNPATHAMTVDFPITEGPQTIVKAVNVEGDEQVAKSALPKSLIHPGDPLNPQTLRTDLVNLQSFYADRGNAEVQVTPRTDISPDKTSATITYVIAEGPKIHIDDVVVRGNTYTKTNVILRKASLDKGDPFSYSSILEAQRNLYSMGIFQRVDIQPEQGGTSVSERNVTIQVDEGKDLTISGSVGATKQSELPFSPLGSVSIAHRNLFGTGRYLGLELIGSQDRKEAFLTYREPFIGHYNVPVQFTVFQSDEHRPSAHIVQRGASIEVTKVARFQTQWSIRYEYLIGTCEDGALCDQARQALVPGIDRSITDIKSSSITPTFFWDKRDDPIDPHRGFFTTALVQYAFPLFTADAHFMKEFAQASYYFPVSARSVFAVSGRAGLIQPIGTVEINGIDEATPVPYTERFTGGGANSHRAYSLDLLGDLCTSTADGCNGTLIYLLDANGNPTNKVAPIGGNGMFITNLEYRFPIFSSVGGSVFTDIGNVYADSAIHMNNLHYGVGTGIRYVSPIGPLRFDIGYKLRRRDYEKPFAYFVTLGYAF